MKRRFSFYNGASEGFNFGERTKFLSCRRGIGTFFYMGIALGFAGMIRVTCLQSSVFTENLV